MARTRGRQATKAYLRQLPEEIERKLLRGAGRAAVEVFAAGAKARCASQEVRDGIETSVRKRGDLIVARVTVEKGWARSVGTWLEWGTDPHWISVDPELSGGRTAGRVNRMAKDGVLVIQGRFIGKSVWHPGARSHPFMRPTQDEDQTEAIAAAQGYINARVTRRGITGSDEGDDE